MVFSLWKLVENKQHVIREEFKLPNVAFSVQDNFKPSRPVLGIMTAPIRWCFRWVSDAGGGRS